MGPPLALVSVSASEPRSRFSLYQKEPGISQYTYGLTDTSPVERRRTPEVIRSPSLSTHIASGLPCPQKARFLDGSGCVTSPHKPHLT